MANVLALARRFLYYSYSMLNRRLIPHTKIHMRHEYIESANMYYTTGQIFLLNRNHLD